MKTEHFNQLTPAETERLAILSEECGESVQIIGKILRHGFDSRNPNDPNGKGNRELLEHELAHIQHMIDRMIRAGDLTLPGIYRAQVQKEESIQKYLHHQ